LALIRDAPFVRVTLTFIKDIHPVAGIVNVITAINNEPLLKNQTRSQEETALINVKNNKNEKQI